MAGKKKAALGNGLEGLFGIDETVVEDKKWYAMTKSRL